MRGRLLVAALLTVLLAATALASASPAAARSDACVAVRLSPGAMMTGAQLADCVTTRMSASGPGRTRVTVDGRIGAEQRATGSLRVLASAIRSVPRWGVLEAERGVDGDGDALRVWRIVPSITDGYDALDAGETVIELSDDLLPVQLTSTLAIGHIRTAYAQSWAGWRAAETLWCASCQGLARPAHRG